MIKPYDWQKEVLESSGHLRIVVGGRRIGKSTLCGLVVSSYDKVLWLAPNYHMTLYARDVIVGAIPKMVYRSYNSLDLEELKGIPFDLVVVDELIAVTVKDRIEVLNIMWELWKEYPQADWLITGTPAGGVELPFPTEVKIPQPLKVFESLTEQAWHIPSTDESLRTLMSEKVYREEVLAEFLK